MKLETYIAIKLIKDLENVYLDIFSDENEDLDTRKKYRDLYFKIRSKDYSLEQILDMQLEYADIYTIADFIKHYTVTFLRWRYLIECTDFRELERHFDDETLDCIEKEIKEHMESRVKDEEPSYSMVINWYNGSVSTDDFISHLKS